MRRIAISDVSGEVTPAVETTGRCTAAVSNSSAKRFSSLIVLTWYAISISATKFQLWSTAVAE